MSRIRARNEKGRGGGPATPQSLPDRVDIPGIGYLAQLEHRGNYWVHDTNGKAHFPIVGPLCGWRAVMNLREKLSKTTPTATSNSRLTAKRPIEPFPTRLGPSFYPAEATEPVLFDAITKAASTVKRDHGGNIALTASPSSEFISRIGRHLCYSLRIVAPGTEHQNQRLARAIIGPLSPTPRTAVAIHEKARAILSATPSRALLIVGADNLFLDLKGRKLLQAQNELKYFANQSDRPFILLGGPIMWRAIFDNAQLKWRFTLPLATQVS
ncbi:hypothetical protein [Hyphomicrobium sp. CS1BSMeth3]|uniref:hypothetical protein n=1 Tax=Hyphomicrobium sp. CS1BSMeth3 TaxID=1892844 RepID=UPI0011609C68|nr:hypothetical protein [Hyphomicrobium sp. CS1BSMeth3]